MQAAPVSPSAEALPASIGAHYRVLAQLGRGGSAYGVAAALTRWVLALGTEQPIVFAIDDLQRLDEATLAWLAALAPAAPRSRLLFNVTAEREAGREGSAALSAEARKKFDQIP